MFSLVISAFVLTQQVSAWTPLSGSFSKSDGLSTFPSLADLDTDGDGLVSEAEHLVYFNNELEEHFDDADKNKDKSLSTLELEDLPYMIDFDLTDEDGDGKATIDEVAKALAWRPTLNFLFCDQKHDGWIDAKELNCLFQFTLEENKFGMQRYNTLSTKPELAFEATDINEDGSISYDEFKEWKVLKLGLVFNSAHGDKDKDGLLSEKETTKFLRFFLRSHLNFTDVDRNGDRSASLKEVVTVLVPLAFNESDVDRSNSLSKEEFAAAIEADLIAQTRRRTWRSGMTQLFLGAGAFVVIGYFLARAPTPTPHDEIDKQRLLSSQDNHDDDGDQDISITTALDNQDDTVHLRRSVVKQ